MKQVLDQVDANLSALDALHWRETTPSGNLQVITETNTILALDNIELMLLLLLLLLSM
jgi:hypothetical protein